jgi:hypothetical protein
VQEVLEVAATLQRKRKHREASFLTVFRAYRKVHVCKKSWCLGR